MRGSGTPQTAPLSGRSRGKLLIPIGIPGSGKSTWAEQRAREGWRIISTDRIRKAIAGSLQSANSPKSQEITNKLTFSSFHKQIKNALIQGDKVVADATNLYPSSRQQLRELAQAANAEVHIVFFTDLELARQRNKKRDPDQIVPDDVMEEMCKLHQECSKDLAKEQYTSVLEASDYTAINRL
jgi:predicted kinase